MASPKTKKRAPSNGGASSTSTPKANRIKLGSKVKLGSRVKLGVKT